MWPSARRGTAWRFTNDGERIFSRCGVPPPLLTIRNPSSPFGFSAEK